MAVAVGTATLIQPELAAGEVALIGKMAADSAKKTITTIASNTSSKVVKAVSKDLADDAEDEQARDIVDQAAREKAEAEADGKTPTLETSDPKTATVGAMIDGGGSVAVDARSAVGLAGATITAKVESKVTIPNSSDAGATPIKDAVPRKEKLATEVAQEPSEGVSNGAGNSSETTTQLLPVAPVSLKITPGADGEMKAVAKGDDKEKSIVTAAIAVAESMPSTTTSAQETTKTATGATEGQQEKELVAPKPPTPQPRSNLEGNLATFPGNPQIVADIPKKDEAVASETTAISPQDTSISEDKPGIIQQATQVTTSTPTPPAPATVSGAATVTNTTKTKATSLTPQETPATTKGQTMVTVSQESLDLLHQSKSFNSYSISLTIVQKSTPCMKQFCKSQKCSLSTCQPLLLMPPDRVLWRILRR